MGLDSCVVTPCEGLFLEKFLKMVFFENGVFKKIIFRKFGCFVSVVMLPARRLVVRDECRFCFAGVCLIRSRLVYMEENQTFIVLRDQARDCVT
jgi:hypothetical protein